MQVTRLYTDTNGESHFEDTPVMMEQEHIMGYYSDPMTDLNMRTSRTCVRTVPGIS